MSYPNLSGLSLGVCATGADDEHAAAAHPALGMGEIVQSILANIRDGEVETVCTMVVNWCKRATKFNSGACEGNEELWQNLAERIFPDWKQVQCQFSGEAWFRNRLWFEFEYAPGTRSMSWKKWFFLLCKHYVGVRLKWRTKVHLAKIKRTRLRINAQAMQAQLDNLPEAARKKGEAPSVKAKRVLLEHEDRLRRAELRWKNAIESLEKTRRDLLEYERMYGRTTDHPSVVERPAYQPPDPRPEVVREVSAETEAGYEASIEEEARADANWNETWDTYDYEKEYNVSDSDSDSPSEDGDGDNPFDGDSDSDG